jgi:integrase/recombinase XerD
MFEHNPKNERIKRRYRHYQLHANRRSLVTVDSMIASICRFERFMGYRYFGDFTYEQAMAFKENLAVIVSALTEKKLSVSTRHSILGHLQKFFRWLSTEQEMLGRLIGTHADYFNVSEKEARVATTRRETRGPSIELVHEVLAHMPNTTAIERRDRALIAFGLLTGARDDAMASFKLKHLRLETNSVYQDARDVRTKNSKSFPTYFFPVGENVLSIVADWAHYLREQLAWTDDDPLFPATHTAHDAEGLLSSFGLVRRMWSTTSPIRRIYRTAFESAGLPYFNPHSFRDTLVRHGYTTCKTPEQLKAWSQNLGHESILTTIGSYGAMTESRQAELIAGLHTVNSTADDVAAALATLSKHFGSRSP